MMTGALTRSRIRAEAMRLVAEFEAAGATRVEASILQPAETLLDLYGEDIRARAYVTSDALRGEQMLRPDFTVPVVQMHMSDGAEPARYTYCGEVFRRQEDDPERLNEYFQAGFELFDGSAPAEADAEVFALIHGLVAPLGLRAATGDIGILIAAVDGLDTTERRKRALRRHIWHPPRFRALIERFSGQAAVPDSRSALLASQTPMETDFPVIGLRRPAEIADRIAALRADAATPPISAHELHQIEALLNLRGDAASALAGLRRIAADLPAIVPAIDRLETRLSALADRGIDPETLDFEGSYGRTQMEYYDGFVFGFYAEAQGTLPPVATGGRYDALTRRLGQGRAIPAVGGVIRPGLMLRLQGGAA